MNKCPICGTEGFREGNICHIRHGETVCVDCCRTCEHHQGLYRCCVRYHMKTEEKKSLIDREIEESEKRLKDYTEQGLEILATKEEMKLICLRGKRRAIENEK